VFIHKPSLLSNPEEEHRSIGIIDLEYMGSSVSHHRLHDSPIERIYAIRSLQVTGQLRRRLDRELNPPRQGRHTNGRFSRSDSRSVRFEVDVSRIQFRSRAAAVKGLYHHRVQSEGNS